MTDQVFNGRLLPGEQILWSGQPGRGIILTGRDVTLVPFSLLWCGFMIFWEFSVWRSRAPGFFKIWGALFICMGIYFVAGRFLIDAWLRRQAHYALTDRRVLIQRSKPFSNFMAVSLDRLPDAGLTERSDGSGTIRFGPPASPWGGRGFSAWAPALDPTPQFIAIPDVRRVFDLVQRSAGRTG